MTRFPHLLVCAVALGTSACATSRYCIGDQPYQNAQTIPALEGTEGLNIPSSQTALVIPDPPAERVPYGEVVVDEDGDKRARCLDRPPEMPPLASSEGAN